MEQIIKVSVIVPVYNAEKTINNCFKSLENQTLDKIEIIYIDDGSTDDSYIVLRELCSKSTKSKVYTKKNAGPSNTRNYGIELACGQYIMFCDSDDIVEPEWCESLYEASQKNSCLSLCHIERDNLSGEVQWDTLSQYWHDTEQCYEMISIKDVYLIYKGQLLNSPCNKLYSASILKENQIRFNEEMSLGEDLLFNIEYFNAADERQICVVNKVLYKYIIANEDSLTGKYRDDYFSIQHTIFSCLIDFLKTKGEDKEIVFETLYYDYFYLVFNYFDKYIKNDKHSFIYKANKLTKILKEDDIINKALKICKFQNDSYIFVKIIKLKVYYAIWLYKKGNGLIQWLRRK